MEKRKLSIIQHIAKQQQKYFRPKMTQEDGGNKASHTPTKCTTRKSSTRSGGEKTHRTKRLRSYREQIPQHPAA
jgi:hypothetical protein